MQARQAFDELVEVGGVPMRPWADCHHEDLTEAQRGDDDGERHIANFYYQELYYWEDQMKLWRRFGKRRAMDDLPSLRDLSPIDAVAAFITYLRGHLEMDLENRAKPGCEVWHAFGSMSQHRSFIHKVVAMLPAFENQHRRLRAEAGDETAMDDPELTVEGLKEEYNIPGWHIPNDSLWIHRQSSVTPRSTPPPLPPGFSIFDPPMGTDEGDGANRPPKRPRSHLDEEEDEEDQEEEDRPPKRTATSPKPDVSHSIRQKSPPTAQSPVAQPDAESVEFEPEREDENEDENKPQTTTTKPSQNSDAPPPPSSPPPEPTNTNHNGSVPQPDSPGAVSTAENGNTRQEGEDSGGEEDSTGEDQDGHDETDGNAQQPQESRSGCQGGDE